ncbi:16345_t:CDS:2 [Entrophospora sp. SA101]|nr:16345_t:CDS:2 [Entrophospora sp. SA101]
MNKIKKLNVRSNLLTSLKFLGNLENLEELELEELIESARENPQRLLNENEKLKEELEFFQQKYDTLKKTLESFSKEIQEQIKEKEINELDNEIEKTEAKAKELAKIINTQELVASLEDKLKKLKRIKEERTIELRDLKKRNQELEQKLKEQIALCQKKEIELETKLDEAKKKEYKLEGELAAVRDEVKHLRSLREKQGNQSNESLVGTLINQLREKRTLTLEEAKQINNYLKTKKDFLLARQETISKLKICCNELDKFIEGKYATINELGNAISNAGGTIADVVTLGIPRVAGEAVILVNNVFKIRFSAKHSKEFQVFLENEEEELTQLDSVCKALTNILNLNDEAKPFNTDCKIFDVLTDEGIWEGRFLNSERMETAVKTLNKNLKTLKIEQEEEIKELQSQFGKDKINLSLAQKEDLQSQTQAKETELTKLINSAKFKLKSNSKFSDTKRQEREEKSAVFFKNLPTNPEEFIKSLENIKAGLSKKLTNEEINSLCRTSQELRQLELDLQDQQQAQILQPTNPPYGTPSSTR